jgi:hypothetical protein
VQCSRGVRARGRRSSRSSIAASARVRSQSRAGRRGSSSRGNQRGSGPGSGRVGNTVSSAGPRDDRRASGAASCGWPAGRVARLRARLNRPRRFHRRRLHLRRLRLRRPDPHRRRHPHRQRHRTSTGSVSGRWPGPASSTNLTAEWCSSRAARTTRALACPQASRRLRTSPSTSVPTTGPQPAKFSRISPRTATTRSASSSTVLVRRAASAIRRRLTISPTATWRASSIS